MRHHAGLNAHAESLGCITAIFAALLLRSFVLFARDTSKIVRWNKFVVPVESVRLHSTSNCELEPSNFEPCETLARVVYRELFVLLYFRDFYTKKPCISNTQIVNTAHQ